MIELKPYRPSLLLAEPDDKKHSGREIAAREFTPPVINHTLSRLVAGAVGVAFCMGLVAAAITNNARWFTLAFLLLGVFGFIALAVWQMSASTSLPPATLHISSDHLPRGGAIEVRFHQAFPRETVITEATCEIITREWVCYRKGTHLTTETHDTLIKGIWEPETRIPANQAFTMSLTSNIPDDAMHSFAFSDNRLTWLIRVTLNIKDFKTVSNVYAFQVTPEIHTL